MQERNLFSWDNYSHILLAYFVAVVFAVHVLTEQERDFAIIIGAIYKVFSLVLQYLVILLA